EDWTIFGLRAVRTAFDSTWAVFADRLAAPSLDSGEVELVRAQMLAGARALRDSPDELVEYLADSAAFAGHPYALAAGGTERSLARISLPDLRRYRDSQLVTSRMLLVVVGNVERARVERLVAATIGKLPRGAYKWAPPPDPGARTAGLTVVQRALPTNYLRAYYTGPSASSPDYQALRVASAVLTGRLFTEIRSRRNLTYAVEAPFVERAISAGGLYVTTVSPDTTVALMRSEVARLKANLIDPVGLARLVQGFITEYFLNTETNAEQGDFLARAELYRGDYRVADRFVDEMRRVTPGDVRRVATKYMRDMRWVLVGDPSRLNRARITAF
ncbi:MAG: pitrilysin family protein, partial [Gemmatimonadaceae bacterium]